MIIVCEQVTGLISDANEGTATPDLTSGWKSIPGEIYH